MSDSEGWLFEAVGALRKAHDCSPAARLLKARILRMGISLDVSAEGVLVGDSAPLDSRALLTPREVAVMFRVHTKTVSQWARMGKLASIRTLGGHRRYDAADVVALLADSTTNITD